MGQRSSPRVEVIIVTYGRRELLRSLLESLAPDNQEVRITVIINGFDPETETLLRSTYPHLNIISCQQPLTPAAARNLAISETSAEWLLFLDDDVILPETYFKEGLDFMRAHPQALAFGGSDAPYPGCTKWELSLNITLTSSFATAHTRHRHDSHSKSYASKASEGDLTLCNLWIKSEVFHTMGLYFDEHYQRNEENILLQELSKKTTEIYRCNQLYVAHKRRDHYFAAMKSVASSGCFRMKSILDKGELTNPLYLFPLGSLLLFALSFFWGNLIYPGILLLIYLIGTILMSIHVSLKAKRPDLILLVFINHLGINLAYALGCLKGLLRN